MYAPSRVNERLDAYLKRSKTYYSSRAPDGQDENHPTRYDNAVKCAFCAFSLASKHISPASLDPPPRPTTHQTKIPHFFPGWKLKIPNLPLDVLLEIASHLHPLDLLNCSRTSKAFRSAFLSRGSRAVWLNVLRSLPEFPSCPKDMSEPAYVALVFDDHCFSCGVSKAYYVDYVLRIRLCDGCWGKYVCHGTKILDDVPYEVEDIVTMLLPAFEYECHMVDDGRSWAHHLHPLSHVHQDLYYKPELEKMAGFFWPPPSPEDLKTLRPAMLQRVEDIIERHILAVQLTAWMDLATTSRHINADWTIRNWERVLQDVQDQKYLLPYEPAPDVDDDEISLERRCDPEIYPRADLIRASGGAISLDQHLEENERRQACDDAVREACLSARRKEFRHWYEHMVRHHAADADFDLRTLPNRHDGGGMFGMAVWVNEGRVPIDGDMFYGLLGDQMHGLFTESVDNTMCKLAALTPYEMWDTAMARHRPSQDGGDPQAAAGDASTTAAAAILARADVLFACKECGARGLPWPEINEHWREHWRERHPGTSFWRKKWPGHPGERPKVRFWRDGREVAGAILDEAGLGRGTDRGELDGLVRAGRLYCACGDPELALPEDLTWAKFVHHLWTHWEMSHVRFMPQHNLLPPGYNANSREGWIHDHAPSDCIKLLPKNADTSPASYRHRADSDTRVKIQAVLAKQLEGSFVICAVCEKLLDKGSGGRKDVTLILSSSADAIAYHMEAKHERPFSEGDIYFYKLPGRTLADLYS